MPVFARRSVVRSSAPPRRLRRRPTPTQGRLAVMCTPMPERNLVQAVRDALYEEMERDDRVCILGEDVGRKGGVFKATEGDRKSTRLNSSHVSISYAVFC